MAAEIPNLVKRNGIYYFRCRIPSILTNGRAREVKISLKTGNLTSRLLNVIVEVSDYSRRVIAKTLQNYGSSSVCDRTAQKKQKNRNTELKKTGIAPIV